MDVCSNPGFGEFDPDEFEILDEVGEDDETFEDTKQEVYLEIQSSNCNQDSLLINDPIVCMEPKESVSERLTSDAHADTAAKSPNSPSHENHRSKLKFIINRNIK